MISDGAREAIRQAGFGEVLSAEQIEGGLISQTMRISTKKRSVVVKQCEVAPPDLYAIEADSLKFLRDHGGPRVPEAIAVGPTYLVLEDLGKGEPGPDFWERFGREIAALHQNRADKFGFESDTYLGLLKIDNKWSEDGHEFFARTRILRFLEEARASETLEKSDRVRVERLAARLKDLIPQQGPSLCHGDLWAGNMGATSGGEPFIIDPALYYGWPEAELSMTYAYEGVGPAFFESYMEANPLEDGWKERLELLNIRELLSMIAHNGDQFGTLGRLRALLDKFA